MVVKCPLVSSEHVCPAPTVHVEAILIRSCARWVQVVRDDIDSRLAQHPGPVARTRSDFDDRAISSYRRQRFVGWNGVRKLMGMESAICLKRLYKFRIARWERWRDLRQALDVMLAVCQPDFKIRVAQRRRAGGECAAQD